MKTVAGLSIRRAAGRPDGPARVADAASRTV